MGIMIARLGKSEPVLFAAEELRRYFRLMDPGSDVGILTAERYDPQRENLLWVGEDEAFAPLLPGVENCALDDGVYLRVEGGAGVVTGTNARSVLLAAYRLLRENGCVFLHPGRMGERIPVRTAEQIRADVCESAHSRHRGVCIEGAVGYDHVRNMIDFLPKIGMNAYFIQFFVPGTFFKRWYEHELNPDYPAAPAVITRRDADGIRRALTEEIKKRGLMYHAVGHGWTCEPFGISGDSWEETQTEIPEGLRGLLAETGGSRKLWNGVALNTNLCYGNEKARSAIVHAIADYCVQNPEVDYLHFWLADDSNNQCECPLCRDTVPADFYVQMLNELDEVMTARGIDTKVVFLVYVDLLWAPQTQRIRHPERFTLMFAPITRTYTVPFRPDGAFEGALAPYRRNENIMPQSVAENVAHLRCWQAAFCGDSFDFDYHFMWDHFKDAGYYRMAEILMQDMQNLQDIGLNGMISCQCQRVFFPTALGMHAMAQGLWDRNASFDTLAKWYFGEAYGEYGEQVRAYLKAVSEKYDPPYLRGEKLVLSAEQARGYEALEALLNSFEPLIDDRLETEPVCAEEWRMLKLHAQLVRCMARALKLCALGARKEAAAAWQDAQTFARTIEPQTHERFDVMEFIDVYRKIFRTLGLEET